MFQHFESFSDVRPTEFPVVRSKCISVMILERKGNSCLHMEVNGHNYTKVIVHCRVGVPECQISIKTPIWAGERY